MKVVSMTEARNNFKAIFDSVFNDHDEVIPFDVYNSIKETNYLLSNRNNAQHLLDSVQQLRKGSAKERELIECN